MMTGRVIAVARDAEHRFSKAPAPSIRLIAGLGVEGDAHCGETVQHRSRVAINPSQPNLRQVHLIQAELFAELARAGFRIRPGDLGENVATEGIDLLALPRGTVLAIGGHARIEITGLRNPCLQIDRFRQGLLKSVLERDASGAIVRKAGVMGIILDGGEVRPGDAISAFLPAAPHEPLRPV
ncbi:MOSC domain-containing protein [Consotaella salsifontis]|uniref:MOSC domain-containing protein YiiM n=1 Tax=Consotaella salsifontis TaxID=1365950 RepID=A0A1T4SD17_9HYPH|nr:MOSC domain-containing protein [Consotaella salsifontis]SKA26164.1 MOSC domain-containing protein YiiM [Consotaella salsifontis]